MKKPRGESNQVILLVSQDLGCIYAISQGTRSLSSKLRSNLDLYASVSVDLVRGKDAWRLISVRPVPKERPLSPSVVPIFARIATLVKRLTPGEDRNEEIFEILLSVREFLQKEKTFERKEMECAAAIKLLGALGYGPEGFLANVAKAPFPEAVSLVHPVFKSAIKYVNTALLESQL